MSPLAAIAVGPTAEYPGLRPVTHRTSAVSDATGTVRHAARRLTDFAERSVALFGRKRATISDIWALVQESRETGAQLEDAQPISLIAAERAADFVRALPDNLPLPELAWEPDGSISLDWIQARHRLLSVSIGEGYRLPYAWLDGAEAGHAAAPFDGDTVPERILDAIRRITQRGSAAVRAS